MGGCPRAAFGPLPPPPRRRPRRWQPHGLPDRGERGCRPRSAAAGLEPTGSGVASGWSHDRRRRGARCLGWPWGGRGVGGDQGLGGAERGRRPLMGRLGVPTRWKRLPRPPLEPGGPPDFPPPDEAQFPFELRGGDDTRPARLPPSRAWPRWARAAACSHLRPPARAGGPPRPGAPGLGVPGDSVCSSAIPGRPGFC